MKTIVTAVDIRDIPIKDIENNGTLLNVFLHDRRNKDEILTYTATRAFLAKDETKTVLYIWKMV